jgi:hypothetical protein
MVYALNDYYLDQPDGPVDSAVRRASPLQYEIGITMGFPETRRIWRIPLPCGGLQTCGSFARHPHAFRVLP